MTNPQDRPVAEIIAEGKTYDHVARGYDCKYVAYDGKPMPGSGQSNECRIIHELTEALERLSKRAEELEARNERLRGFLDHSTAAKCVLCGVRAAHAIHDPRLGHTHVFTGKDGGGK